MFIVKVNGTEVTRNENLLACFVRISDRYPDTSPRELLALGWEITTDAQEQKTA